MASLVRLFYLGCKQPNRCNSLTATLHSHCTSPKQRQSKSLSLGDCSATSRLCLELQYLKILRPCGLCSSFVFWYSGIQTCAWLCRDHLWFVAFFWLLLCPQLSTSKDDAPSPGSQEKPVGNFDITFLPKMQVMLRPCLCP